MSASCYAGIVSRCAATAIDVFLLAVLVPLIATGAPSAWASVTGRSPGWLAVCAQCVAACLPIGYFTLCWWSSGQTLGGLLFGVVVRTRSAARLGVMRAFLRASAGLLLAALWLPGMIAILIDPRRRALHDRVFGTVVLRRSRVTPER